jgi:hypothetical protein
MTTEMSYNALDIVVVSVTKIILLNPYGNSVSPKGNRLLLHQAGFLLWLAFPPTSSLR